MRNRDVACLHRYPNIESHQPDREFASALPQEPPNSGRRQPC